MNVWMDTWAWVGLAWLVVNGLVVLAFYKGWVSFEVRKHD